jgi:phage terminase large subunit-like protein/intein/homing endonuclease
MTSPAEIPYARIAQEIRERMNLGEAIATNRTVEAVRERCKRSLAAFVQEAWHVLEPGNRYIHTWLVDSMCEHLEAVTAGMLTRLLINVPPGSMKSLLVSVMWPAWEWGPKGLTQHRFISTSFAESAVVRDTRKMRTLVSSEWYRKHWPHVVLTRTGELSFENSMMGARDGVAFGSLTSRRGDRLILDDPHSVEKAESQLDRERAVRRFREGAVNRLNNQAKSAIVVIMQRLHECLLPGTLVRTPSGETAIEAVARGDLVYGSAGWTPVLTTARHSYADLAYGVTMYCHPAQCWTTREHLYLADRGWVRADALTCGDWVFLPAPGSASEIEWEDPRWAPPPGRTGTFTGKKISLGAASAVDGEILAAQAARGLSNSEIAALFGVHRNTIQCHMNYYGVARMKDRNPVFGREHLSDPDFWRCVGYWMAEGSFISGRNGQKVGVRLTFGEREREFVDDVTSVLGRYGIRPTMAIKKSVLEPQFHCSQLARWFYRHFGSGAHHKHLPEFVFGLAPECREQLLEGWLRGDGGMRGKERGGTSVSHALIHDLQRLCLGLGYNARIHPSYAGPRDLMIDGRLCRTSGAQRELRIVRTDDQRSKMRLGSDGWWVRVRKIETKPYIGPVYDIKTGSGDFVVGNATVHNSDISGEILEHMPDYTALVLPMEYEASRHCETEIGFSDPRKFEGELLAPERWGPEVIANLKRDMQKFAWAGQYMQRPAPRGGGIIPYVGWELWSKKVALQYGRNESQFPDFDIIIGSVDTAYTEKQENDFSAMTVWGVWQDIHNRPQVMLMQAWQKRMAFNALAEEIVKTARKMKCDRVLIEARGSGMSVIQELRRVFVDERFAIEQVNPTHVTGDKIARANAISHLFGEEEDGISPRRPGVVWAPAVTQVNGAEWMRDWAELCAAQCASFPKGKHDDLVDTVVQALKWFRDRGILRKASETGAEEIAELMRSPVAPQSLYPT